MTSKRPPPTKEVHISVQDPSSALRELEEALLVQAQCYEVWIDFGPEPTLSALINETRGWLIYMRYDGDAGFSSRNPEHAGEERELEFRLGNGQLDVYPIEYTFPKTKIIEVLKYFIVNRRVPDWLDWFNDSGDGNTSPNEPFIET